MKLAWSHDNMTSDEWLALAIEQEKLAKTAGPFDPAYEGLMKAMHDSLNQAIRLERKGVK